VYLKLLTIPRLRPRRRTGRRHSLAHIMSASHQSKQSTTQMGCSGLLPVLTPTNSVCRMEEFVPLSQPAGLSTNWLRRSTTTPTRAREWMMMQMDPSSRFGVVTDSWASPSTQNSCLVCLVRLVSLVRNDGSKSLVTMHFHVQVLFIGGLMAFRPIFWHVGHKSCPCEIGLKCQNISQVHQI
jgi:hypothetical protein